MKSKWHIAASLCFLTAWASAQYTELINSNRPGASVSAFSVGKNVLQGEMGAFLEQQEHTGLLTKSNFVGADFSIRYGFLLERLEIMWEGTFQREKLTDNSTAPPVSFVRSDFLANTVGLKYLLYDPYLKPEKMNVYSWKANHSFKWNDLIPAVSLYAGANLVFGDNPFWINDPVVSPKVMVATQHHFMERWVFVTNIMYDRFTTDDPVFGYVLTLTHALKGDAWSIFAEHQGIKSHAYADGIFRGGAAYLVQKDLQLDAALGINIKDTPSRLFGAIGVSYRLDNHKD